MNEPAASPSIARGEHWRREFWLQYVLATSVGFTVGGFLAGGIIRAIDDYRGGQEWSPIDGLALGGAVFGVVIATMQWLVLRREIAHAGWWVPTTSLGWAGSFTLVAVATQIGRNFESLGVLAGALAFATIGPVTAMMQWLVLRRPFREAGTWVLGSGVSFIAAILVAAAVLYAFSVAGWFEPEDFPSAGPWGVLGAVAGPVYGAASGALLLEEFRRLRAPARP